VREPEPSDVLCTNCHHPFRDHSSGGCSCSAEMNDETGELCTCVLYAPWDSQPADVYVPFDATLSELIALRKAATADGRMAPPELSERIQAMRESKPFADARDVLTKAFGPENRK
jgi:hypothetical protein